MKNRNFKDSVFVDLFAKDITAKEMHGTTTGQYSTTYKDL